MTPPVAPPTPPLPHLSFCTSHHHPFLQSPNIETSTGLQYTRWTRTARTRQISESLIIDYEERVGRSSCDSPLGMAAWAGCHMLVAVRDLRSPASTPDVGCRSDVARRLRGRCVLRARATCIFLRACVYPVSAIQYPVSAILDLCKYVQYCVCAIHRYPLYPVSAILHI